MLGVRAININESCCHIVIIKLGGAVLKQISALQAPGDSASQSPGSSSESIFHYRSYHRGQVGEYLYRHGDNDIRQPGASRLEREGEDEYGNN